MIRGVLPSRPLAAFCWTQYYDLPVSAVDEGATMELIKFRITNFRSVNDSGDIAVGDLTSLVGRNESGKSALLLALATLSPAGGRQPLSKIKDFPRGRRLEECKPDTPVVESHWKLTADETAQMAKTLGHGDPITQVAIGRGYGPDAWVELR